MEALQQHFSDRLAEIDSYLELLAVFETQKSNGPQKIAPEGSLVSTTQQRILYSSVYLQLYNLIEATMTKCQEALHSAIVKDSSWKPYQLSEKLQKEWVRYLSKAHTEQSTDKRFNYAIEMFEHLIKERSIESIEIEKSHSGNWNDDKIEGFAKRLGCPLKITKQSKKNIKINWQDDLGALKFVVKKRNDLAHGAISFNECGDGRTADELKELKCRVAAYMKEVVTSFSKFINNHSFIQPEHRPPRVQME